ncbi:uncharacterized protein LOC118457378 isoform X1 [Anopheles albimanus]|uniref:uncharacterized protein LOC118457378 isoform X1 n=1 Tax=Anopheles albimanus TaxID=7167 RepID=UPI00163F9FFD|nr:uncharacterized protein LOC118457378 isoform X1 [Anopheles albimanus]
MRLIATCVLCKVKLSCEPANTRILIDHLQRLHCLQPPSPGESKPFSPIMPQPQKLKNNLRTAAVKETKNQANVAAPTSVESTGSNLRTGTRRRIAYKTTVAEWSPAQCRVKCPECDGHFYPTVRFVTSRISRSVFAAYCLLFCWPLCLLSCLFNQPVKPHLHCSNCNAFLGLYDARSTRRSARRKQ